MNNEPVAWIVKTFDADKGKTVEAIWDFKPMNTIGCTPLYTHPAKTLTDELKALLHSVNGDCYLGKEKEEALVTQVRKQYSEPAKTLTDAEQDACFNRGYKEGARDILNRQAKTLTDEEIQDIHNHNYGWDGDNSTLRFARAILRKAQEK